MMRSGVIITLCLLSIVDTTCGQFRVRQGNTPKPVSAAPARSASTPAYRPATRAYDNRTGPSAVLQNTYLLLATDSACVVKLTGVKAYSFTLTADSKTKEKVLAGEYLLEAEGQRPGMRISRTVRVSNDLKVEPLEFSRLVDRIRKIDTLAATPPPPPRYKDPILNEISANMVLVEGGSFEMGDLFSEGKSDNVPAHTVRLTNFYISKYEVTVVQFRQFVRESGYRTDAEKNEGAYINTATGNADVWEKRKDLSWNTDASGKVHADESEREPVLFVSWNDAQAFCQWLSQKTNRVFGLPTEAQWEYAARGGNRSLSTTYAGSGKVDDIAWFTGNSGRKAHLVGQKKPNELGLFDMSGNAWEWCLDRYDRKYYDKSPTENPTGATKGDKRVVRGGSWRSDLKELRVVNRHSANPDEGFHSVGFRVVTSTP